jgi:ACS family D-galactonate transporter-like MFS transporter
MTGVTPATLPVRVKLPAHLYRVALLLALSIFINYFDRGSLSLAAPFIKSDLGLSDYQLGIVLSAFFWTYAGFQMVSGWLVDRLDVNWVLFGGVALWCAATAATGLANSFCALVAMRLLLGVGESVAYPSYSKIIANHFPESQRGRANAFIGVGYTCGSALGTFLGALLMAKVGWHLFFVVIGVAGGFWLLPWIKWRPRDVMLPRSTFASISILEIISQRSAWGTFAGLFSYNYLLYFLVTWLPSYLIRERHLSIRAMSTVGGMTFLTLGLSVAACGWLSDRWIAAGAAPTLVRKTFTAAGLAGAATITFAFVIPDPRMALAFLVFASVSAGACSSNLWAITQTLAGSYTAGKWTGVQNFIGNLAGIVAPALTGLILMKTGRFFWAAAITSLVCLLGAFAWAFVIKRVEPVAWKMREV